MSSHSTRVHAIRAVLKSSIINTSTCYQVIDTELTEIMRTRKVHPHSRRHLLQTLHATRALDTSLREFTKAHGIPVVQASLGEYLGALVKHRKASLRLLPKIKKDYYQLAIVSVRNQYMHEAGAFPANDTEIRTLLSEMESCLVTVLAL
jgi:hypothetical protein